MSNFDPNNSNKTIFVDIGNTSIKIGRKIDSNWTTQRFKDLELLRTEIGNQNSITEIVIASVRKELTQDLVALLNSYSLRVLSVSEIEANKLDYDTPETLGIDRYLACLGAKSKSEQAVVVIDAGSACTIDFMDASGVFKGGVIMPGLSAVQNVFKLTAPELPNVDLELPNQFPGKSTKSSIQIGLTQFFIDGINSNLHRYMESFGEFDLFVTGGDADFIQSSVFKTMTVNRTLIFDGMEQLLFKS